MPVIVQWLIGLMILAGGLVYEYFIQASPWVLVETLILGISAILGILHLISLWRHRR